MTLLEDSALARIHGGTGFWSGYMSGSLGGPAPIGSLSGMIGYNAGQESSRSETSVRDGVKYERVCRPWCREQRVD